MPPQSHFAEQSPLTGRIGSNRGLEQLIGEVVEDTNERIEFGRTLPAQAYTSPDFFQVEMEALFKTDWICVGHVSQVAKVGDYFTYNLLNEPMVVVRAREGIKVHSSVCRHRWAPVATGSGNAPAFSCPFHKWTYDLDGKLVGAPLMHKAECFDKKGISLHEFRSEVVEELGLIFVTFSSTINSINERLATLIARSKSRGWDLKDQVVVDIDPQSNSYNWKAQAETYAECYHHLGGHETTIEKALPAAMSSCEEDKGTWTMSHARLTDQPAKLNAIEQDVYNAFANGANPGDVVLEMIIIYPLTLIAIFKDSCDVRLLRPLAADLTESTALVTCRREHQQSEDFPQWLADYERGSRMVNDEDNAINRMQQIGVSSAFATVGRFSHLEACAFHLADYVRKGVRTYTQDTGATAEAAPKASLAVQ